VSREHGSPLLREFPALQDGPGEASGSSPRLALEATILVVDDDDGIRESLTWLLEDEGYRVHVAAHGREALVVLERIVLPVLALVDLRMPIMDGVELIEVLRLDPRYATLPVVAFSAASTVAPPDGIPLLQKPIGVEPLLSAVRAHARGGWI
jgi:CheY-like chemotaxis protein